MLAIIDYGYGNIRSVHNALLKIGANNVHITSKTEDIAKASRIILPGVGAYKQCMGALAAIDGMIQALESRVLNDGVPFLGICVGMQLLADSGVEFETTKGLGWIKGEVKRLMPKQKGLKIPQMGWNEAVPQNENPLFKKAWNGLAKDVYFVHSYAFAAHHESNVIAKTDYGGDIFASAIQRNNITGVQFHPEKSQSAGLQLLDAWVNMGLRI